MTGKLNWIADQTRPDLGYDSLLMSYHNRDATIKNINEANKTVKKAMDGDSFIKFSKIGNFNDMKILTYSDASFMTIENKSRSIAGKIIFLSNQDESKLSPLCWKSKTIPQVCKSAKAAETRAVDICADDGLFLARTVSEIFTGKKGKHQIPLIIKSDSNSLKDSLNSTKQVEEKMLRPLLQHLKDMITRQEINSFDWVETYNCHADLLTKKDAKQTDCVMHIIKTGRNIRNNK